MVTEEGMPGIKVIEIMYRECRYLTDEEFKMGVATMLDNYTKVNLPNLFRSLPNYKLYENGKRIDPPRNIEEYCKKYLYKSYAEDKLKEFLKELPRMDMYTLFQEYKESRLTVGEFLEYKITGKKPCID